MHAAEGAEAERWTACRRLLARLPTRGSGALHCGKCIAHATSVSRVCKWRLDGLCSNTNVYGRAAARGWCEDLAAPDVRSAAAPAATSVAAAGPRPPVPLPVPLARNQEAFITFLCESRVARRQWWLFSE